MRLIVISLLLLVMPVPAAAQCEQLRVREGALWSVAGDAQKQIVIDPRGITAAAWSPGGEAIAYAREADFDKELPPDVALIDPSGKELGTFSLPSDTAVNAILELGWRDTNRIWATGHVNPSTSMYLEWNLESRELITREPGTRFSVSPHGRSVAWLENVPYGTPPPFDSATLIIDGKPAWPADERHHRISGHLGWSSDERRLAFLDEVEGVTEVVMVDERGKLLASASVDGPDEPQLLGWDQNVVLIARSDDTAFRVRLTGAVEKTDISVRAFQLQREAERCRPLKR